MLIQCTAEFVSFFTVAEVNLKMASVHESLYFNPMMTNGVVHANVFGIKDWVTPYKISVLALLYEMTASKITLPERRRLNKLILPLQQVGVIDTVTVYCALPCSIWCLLFHGLLTGSRFDSWSVPEDSGGVLPSDRICGQTQVCCFAFIFSIQFLSAMQHCYIEIWWNVMLKCCHVSLLRLLWFPLKVAWNGWWRAKRHGVLLFHSPHSIHCFWYWGL